VILGEIGNVFGMQLGAKNDELELAESMLYLGENKDHEH
jgi:hypothetical protein